MRKELEYWLVHGLIAVLAVATVKIIAAQPWAPPGVHKFGGFL